MLRIKGLILQCQFDQISSSKYWKSQEFGFTLFTKKQTYKTSTNHRVIHHLSLHHNLSFSGCTALKLLNCSDNQLIVLPMNIRKCKSLKDLALTNNKLTLLTNALGQLAALGALHLKGKPSPPSHVLTMFRE